METAVQWPKFHRPWPTRVNVDPRKSPAVWTQLIDRPIQHCNEPLSYRFQGKEGDPALRWTTSEDFFGRKRLFGCWSPETTDQRVRDGIFCPHPFPLLSPRYRSPPSIVRSTVVHFPQYSRFTCQVRHLDSIQICQWIPNSSFNRKYLMDAAPLVGTAASMALVRDLIQDGLLAEVEINMWLASLAFQQKPTLEMITAVTVSV